MDVFNEVAQSVCNNQNSNAFVGVVVRNFWHDMIAEVERLRAEVDRLQQQYTADDMFADVGIDPFGGES